MVSLSFPVRSFAYMRSHIPCLAAADSEALTSDDRAEAGPFRAGSLLTSAHAACCSSVSLADAVLPVIRSQAFCAYAAAVTTRRWSSLTARSHESTYARDKCPRVAVVHVARPD